MTPTPTRADASTATAAALTRDVSELVARLHVALDRITDTEGEIK